MDAAAISNLPQSDGPPPPWRRLLGPLPDDAGPSRKPVGPPAVLAQPHGSAIAGWESVTLELSAGLAGMRHLRVVLDETGRPISAADHVYFREASTADPVAAARIRQESIGGRLEAGGRFLGTCWLVTGLEQPEDEPPRWEMTPRPPTEEETAGLKILVAELVRRLP